MKRKNLICRLCSAVLCAVLCLACLPQFAQASLAEPTKADVVLAQAEDPYKLYFPDVVLIPQEMLPAEEQEDYPEGKLLAAFYRNTGHVPASTDLKDMGKIQMVESRDSGKTWSEPVDVMSPELLLDYGIASTERPLECRDPNFALLSDGTLLLTFFVRHDGKMGEMESYILMSTDCGNTWSEPQLIAHDFTGYCCKRGDITQFANGDVLVPVYTSGRGVGILYHYDPNSKTLTKQWEAPITASNEPDKEVLINEVSFISAPTEQEPGRTYAFAREPGYIYQSDDYGKTWTFLAREYPISGEGSVVQPGLKLLPDGSIFATFAISTHESGRPVFGKRFYPELGWDATIAQLIYQYPGRLGDMADPSAVLLSDQETLFTVYYISKERQICGTFSKIADYEPPTETTWRLSGDLTYICGYPDQTFGVDNLLTRGEMAQMLYRVLAFYNMEPSHSYTDLEGFWGEEAIGTLCAAGILDDDGGKFEPDEPATRAELVKALGRILKIENETVKRKGFTDTAGHELENLFTIFKMRDILDANSSGGIEPDGTLTRVEAVITINRALGLQVKTQSAAPIWRDVEKGYVYAGHIQAATHSSLK